MFEETNLHVRYECNSFDKRLMECDKLDSNSVQGLSVGSQEKVGLSSDVDFVPGKSLAEEMHGREKKPGSKKRSPSVEVGFNSDEDEPIGALFKLKSKRNPKKAKLGSGAGGDKGKQVEIRAENMLVKDEDFGGMNDTLASFRKKLMGPKKGTASGSAAAKDLVINAAEPSCQSLVGAVQEATKSISKIEKGQIDESEGTVDKKIEKKAKSKSKRSKIAFLLKKTGSNVDKMDASEGTVDAELEKKGGGKSKRSKIASLLKKTAGVIEFDDVGLAAKSVEKGEMTDDYGSNDTADKVFEQSRKGKSKRSRIVSLLEKTGGDIEFEDALGSADNNSSHIEKECNFRSGGDSSHCLDDNLEDSLSSFFRKAQSGLVRKSRGSSSLKELQRTRHASEVVTMITGSDDSLHQVSNCTQENLSLGDPMLGISSARRITDEVSGFGDSIHGQPLHQNSQSPLMECSNKTPRLQEGEVNFLHSISEEYIYVKVEDHRSFPCQELTSVIQNVKDENGSSTGKASDLAHDVADTSNLISVQKTTKQLPCENSEPLACNEKTSVPLKPVDGLEFNHCIESTTNKEFTSIDHNKSPQIPSACVQDPEIASISSEKEDASASGSGLSPVSPNRFHISFRGNQLAKSIGTNDNPNPNSQNSPVNDSQNPKTSIDVCVVGQNPSSHSSEDGASSLSTTLYHNGSYADDTISNLDHESKEMKLSVGQRVMRKPKKHRHGDMAYEGDADWEILMHDQDFLVSHQIGDEGESIKTNKKLNFLSTMAENGRVAAVSSGLKARAAGPVEKIKFKEVLKRKGGLQEYLEYRNHILGLWSKDVSRILSLLECGVSDTPLADEPQCASLIRDIYTFLDHYGYINFGVASTKETSAAIAGHNLELLEEKKPMGPPADSDDGVSFALCGGKHLETSMEENIDSKLDDENRVYHLQPLELSSPTVPEGSPAVFCEQKCPINAKPSNKKLGSAIEEVGNSGATPGTCEELQKESHCNEGNDPMDCESQVLRKRVIVIGAGPAGLTAARHLQRQGFHVTVLEARSRIGGRVFTDRSSLSVPVDLGASIITGVEADVAAERRPDPSSLVCAQLGLELTILNSDCPLYDIVTGEKVPPDLDGSLEEEYNSLLDDTLVLVAQQGEQAMRLSLEDGLEYALKNRRTVRPERHRSIDGALAGPDDNASEEEILSPLERRVLDWHFAHLEYGCAALLKQVSLPHWNQDDVYGGFGGAHCMIKGGYSNVVESLAEGLCIHLNHAVTDVSYFSKDRGCNGDHYHKVRVSTSNGLNFSGDAVLITVPLGCLKAEAIKFSPSLPQWKYSSIQRLGFGVLNKVVMEFPKVFWDDSVDYFGATAEETNKRGQCFMFWNVKKTVGAPVLIALVVGKAAIDGQDLSSSYHVNHAVKVLRKLFGEINVPDPVASVVTDWGRDPYSYGAYSFVSVGATGEDYDILGRPVENCLFFAGEATCKEHPDTVGGAMMSGLREAVRIIDILSTGSDYTAEVDAMEAAQRRSYGEKSEVRDIIKRLEAIDLSDVLYKNSFDGTREGLLKDMFGNAKTAAGRLHLVKELLNLPVEVLKSFAGTKEGLSTLNSWILDSLGKDGTQLLRHCVRLLVLVSTDLLAVRFSGIGKTVKDKVCVHTSRDIRAIASQLVNVWIEVFRKEKASNGGLKLLRQSTALDSSKNKCNILSGKPPLRTGAPDKKGSSKVASAHNVNLRKVKPAKLDTRTEVKPSMSQGSAGRQDSQGEDKDFMTEEEKAALAAAEAARAAELAAAEAYASSSARYNTSLQLPKIPSFHKFARREQYAQMDEVELKKKWSGGVLGRQDCISEIDSRNCRVRDWSVDFSAAGVNLDSSKISLDNRSPRSHSNEIPSQLNFREHSGESVAADSGIFTKAWVDSAGSEGLKDYSAIERWQSQAAAADSDYFHRAMHLRDEEESNMGSNPPTWKHNESSASQVTTNRELVNNSQPRGLEHIKQAVVDYVASLLMPLYKARKIDRDGYKSIMKKTATKVVEQTTDAEKVMAVFEFLDFKRKRKIRAFVDMLIERYIQTKPAAKS